MDREYTWIESKTSRLKPGDLAAGPHAQTQNGHFATVSPLDQTQGSAAGGIDVGRT